MKKIISLVSIFSLLMVVNVASAKPNTERTPATNNNSGKGVVIPAHAVQVADHVFSLGTSIDPEHGDLVEGFMIVHPQKGNAKPDGTPGGGKGGGKKDGGSSCYAFLAKDAKWKTVEPWVVNPSNTFGITDASVFSILDGGVNKWEDAADGEVADGGFIDIVGSGSITSNVLVADESSVDGVNEVYFGALDEGTIGVTIVWGIFGGKPQNRELREWDQVYNTFYNWSDTGAPDAMDFDNIATHELGHTMGLADLYTTECVDETMYGYGSEGEIKNRDLNAGDIAGISKLY